MATTGRGNACPGITRRSRLAPTLVLACAVTVMIGTATTTSASAATLPIPLGSAANFAVLAGSGVTNTGPTTINGDLGVSPGTSAAGLQPGRVTGAIDMADDVAAQAEIDLATAYDVAATTPTTAVIPTELGGATIAPGVYEAPTGTFGIDGTLTMDAQGNPDAVFIFKTTSNLSTAPASNVILANGAQAANVYWQIGSSALLGPYSTVSGNILALGSIAIAKGVTVDGRALARTAAVTLDTDLVIPPVEPQLPHGTVTSLSVSPAVVPFYQPIILVAVVTANSGTASPTGQVVFTDQGRSVGFGIINQDGSAELTTRLGVGPHLISAVYSGTDEFGGSTSAGVAEFVEPS